MEPLPRIRTIPQAVTEIKEIDPDSAVTITCVRSLVKKGIIPRVDAGGRIAYINLDSVIEYFQNPAPANSKIVGSIRPVRT